MWAGLWNAATGLIVLHHIGLFAGAILVIGPTLDKHDPPAPVPGRSPSPEDHSGHHD